MELYLVRHAEAVERAEGLEDGVRWLTSKGRSAMRAMAARLRRKQVRPSLLITSPLTRAVQTAELLLPEMGKKVRLIADLRLAADGTVDDILGLLSEQRGAGDLLLVGHEPLLSRLAAALLRAEPAFRFGKGACLALQLRANAEKPAKFLWYAPPKGTTIRSAKKACVPAS